MLFYKKLGTVKALSFDLDDTLYDNSFAMQKAESDFAIYLKEKYNLPEHTKDVSFWAEIKREVKDTCPDIAHDVTELRKVALIKAFRSLGLNNLTEREALDLVYYFVHLRSSNIKVDAKVKDMLARLGEKYPLAALSNGNVDSIKIGLKEYFLYDLRPQFGKIRSKPSPDLFYLYADKLKLCPQDILHVGDEPYTDVLGAVGANCQCAYLYKGYAGLSSPFTDMRLLPTFELSNIHELENLLL